MIKMYCNYVIIFLCSYIYLSSIARQSRNDDVLFTHVLNLITKLWLFATQFVSVKMNLIKFIRSRFVEFHFYEKVEIWIPSTIMQSYHILTEVLCHDKMKWIENGSDEKCLCQMIKDKEIRLILSPLITKTKYCLSFVFLGSQM